jgi:hypothetical protein
MPLLRMSICVVVSVALFSVCLEWYRAVRRDCTHVDPKIRARARWIAYEFVWSVCLVAAALAIITILLAAAYIKIADGTQSAFESLVQIPISVLLASVLLSLKARVAPFAVCLTGDWCLGHYAVTGDVSFQTPLRTLFESFTDFLPDPLRLVWVVVTLAFLTFSWLRVLNAKADVMEAVA